MLKIQCIVSLGSVVEILQKDDFFGGWIQPYPGLLICAVPQLIGQLCVQKGILHYSLSLIELCLVIQSFELLHIIGGVDCGDTFFGSICSFQRVARFEAIVNTSDSIEPILRIAVLNKIPSVCHVIIFRLKLLPYWSVIVDLSVESLRYGLRWYFNVERKSKLYLEDGKQNYLQYESFH